MKLFSATTGKDILLMAKELYGGMVKWKQLINSIRYYTMTTIETITKQIIKNIRQRKQSEFDILYAGDEKQMAFLKRLYDLLKK
jgi:hypothetical protein